VSGGLAAVDVQDLAGAAAARVYDDVEAPVEKPEGGRK
jgi:hypothetical protein